MRIRVALLFAQYGAQKLWGFAGGNQKWTDLMFVVSGEATLLIGGKVVNARTTSPGEIRGTTSTGGEKKVIRQGDVVQVAARVPHQFLIPAGRQITFFTMKIAAQ